MGVDIQFIQNMIVDGDGSDQEDFEDEEEDDDHASEYSIDINNLEEEL